MKDDSRIIYKDGQEVEDLPMIIFGHDNCVSRSLQYGKNYTRMSTFNPQVSIALFKKGAGVENYCVQYKGDFLFEAVKLAGLDRASNVEIQRFLDEALFTYGKLYVSGLGHMVASVAITNRYQRGDVSWEISTFSGKTGERVEPVEKASSFEELREKVHEKYLEKVKVQLRSK